MSHAVNWFQISGPNGRALQQFYKQIFGWQMKPLPGAGDMLMVPPEKDGIAGGIGTSQNHQPSVAVYVSVGDVDAVLGKIERGGGRIAMPKTELPGNMGWIGGFTDPAGNWVGIWMPPAKAAAPKRAASKASTKKSGAAKKASAKRTAAPKAKAKAASKSGGAKKKK